MKKEYIFILVFITILIFFSCGKENEKKINSFEDLGKRGVSISIANPEYAPVGMYTMKVLENLKKENEELAERILNNIVSKEPHVRAVLDKVVSKAVDAGFVYITDAMMEKDKVKIIEIPEEIQVEPLYGICILTNKREAKEFLNFVFSEKSTEIMKKYGFIPIKSKKFLPKKCEDSQLIVYVAASLKDLFSDISKEFEEITGCKVKIFFSSSGILRTKIEEGAPADLFASASLKQLDILKNEGIIGNYEKLLKNKLVIITAK